MLRQVLYLIMLAHFGSKQVENTRLYQDLNILFFYVKKKKKRI